MKRLIGWLFGLLLFLAALPSCREVSRHRQLKDIWTYVDDAPDSALRVLEAMPSPRFTLPSDRADFALLKSIALDKNYIDVTDDSLARVATEWYDVHGRPERQLRAWYYLGRVQQNAGNPSGAIVSFQRAKQLAETSGDLFYEGMACRAMGEVYRDAFFKDEALESIRRAHECFVYSDHPTHAKFALLQLARIQYIEGEFEECEKSLIQLKQALDSTIDNRLFASANMIQASCLVQKKQFSRAIHLYNESQRHLGNILSPGTLGSIAYAYHMLSEKDSAEHYLSLAFKKARTSSELTAAKYDRYKIANENRDYETAVRDLRDVLYAQDSSFHFILNQSVIAAQRDAYKDSFQKEESTNKNIRIGIILLSFILCLVVAFIILYIQKSRQEKENNLYQITALRDEIQRMDFLSSEKDRMIAHLFQNHLHWVNDLSDTYLNQEDGQPDSEKRLIRHIQKQIDNLTSDNSVLQELESIVNYTCENVMEFLRKEVKLKTTQYDLMCCFFAGLSGNATRLLSGETRSNIYTSKHRLQATIKQQNPPHLSLFLKYLSA